MSIITRENVLEYHRKGINQINVDENPILTDLAREELQALGMTIVVGGKSATVGGRVASQGSGNAPAGGGGYGNSQLAPTTTSDVTVAQQLTYPNVTKPAFRSVINSNKKLVGTFMGTPHPVMTEHLGHMGLDFVCIDAEHNPIHLETLQKMLQGLAGTPTYGVVRVPTLSYEYVSGALDIGADALLIPQIRTLDDIERLRQYSQYPPVGIRGCGPSRLWDYGDGIGQLATASDSNYTTNIIVQLETVQAVNNIDEIIKTDFIDMFFIGPGDLSMDMGIFGQFTNPKLTDTIMMLREKTARAGKKLGIFAGNFEVAKDWLNKGFDMVIVNSEMAIMSTAITSGVKLVRDAIGE